MRTDDLRCPGCDSACLLEHYPAALVGARVFRGESDDLRHCRSAWAVAVAGEKQTRQVSLFGGVR